MHGFYYASYMQVDNSYHNFSIENHVAIASYQLHKEYNARSSL